MRRVFITLCGVCIALFNGQMQLHAESKSHRVEMSQPASDLPRLTLKEFKKLRRETAIQVLDTRSGDIFLQGFVSISEMLGQGFRSHWANYFASHWGTFRLQ
ncbi:hypothetical protein [Sphingobacterium multivorum]|uniref:hypothetical protein n=1 Tax=Sphingobacterium multivorum TaxID=28454 RepID=UPI003DA43934